MNEDRWPRKFKAATVEGHKGRERPRCGWYNDVKSALAVREVGLQEAAQLAREMSVWRVLVMVSLY